MLLLHRFQHKQDGRRHLLFVPVWSGRLALRGRDQELGWPSSDVRRPTPTTPFWQRFPDHQGCPIFSQLQRESDGLPNWSRPPRSGTARKAHRCARSKFLVTPLPLRLRSPPLLPAYPSHGLEPVTPTLSTRCNRGRLEGGVRLARRARLPHHGCQRKKTTTLDL